MGVPSLLGQLELEDRQLLQLHWGLAGADYQRSLDLDIDKHEPGMFSWADMGTTDPEGAKSFYTELLDLDVMDVPMGEGMSYSMLNRGGRNSCALYRMSPEMEKMSGGQPFWLSYFTVESADETAGRIKEAGGSVTSGPFDVFSSGRMVVAHDPTGAMFSVWEPKDHIGAGIFGEPGALAWNELYTHDTHRAARFYADLFGWSADAATAADGGDYTVFQLNGRAAAGMMAIRPEWGETPPSWSIYFAVADLAASLDKVRELGGKQISPAMEVDGVGRLSFIRDPQGAYSSIIQMTREA
ncbi:MAG: VOC family protein [Aphanocapsa feldmannii 277cV]|uniref:VOC family protein n=2 Tax=Aphanocapsa feldmannii TaxID=192050 RepID=A0A524RRA0_9CHRO|nr:MAG: VOC family protein [Aphanocapsa feldmannii 288cV]TGG96850.1 MAG: VOC family protein [Aphanocapsa feldmannii 277cV]TGH20330.1 MAG: VOC family protein [Aphanocapsa feldmannii 277cI]